MLQDVKRSTDDWKKRKLQRRVREAEKQIQKYKGWISERVRDAAGYEERLGLLKKKGECKT